MPNPRAVAIPAKKKKFEAWSFSRWLDYQLCPFKAYLKHIMKLKEPASPAMERGNLIHKSAEAYAKATGRKKVPAELKMFEAEFKAVQKLNPVTEQQWTFTSKWGTTGWFDPDAWCRQIVDLHWLEDDYLDIVDHKTGKINPDHTEQLSLYAVGGLIKYPQVKGVKVSLWYLDQGEVRPEEPRIYLPKELPALKKEWEKRTKPMLNDTTFAPRPNDKCRWCNWSAAKGGPCKF